MTTLTLNCLFIALIAASVIWCGSVIVRVADIRIKRCFTLISMGVSLMAIINLIKVSVSADNAKLALNWLYLIPALMILIPMIISAVLLAKANKGQKAPGIPLIIIAITIIYALFYALRVPFFASSPITIIGGALIIMMCESCITPKLIKTGADFRKVFVKSELPVAIVDKEKEVAIRTLSEAPANQSISNAIENGGEFKQDENTIITTAKFSGGYIAFANDIKELNMLIDELDQTSQQLQKNSELIAMESEIRDELVQAKMVNHLYDEGLKTASYKLAIVSNILNSLPENDEKSRDDMVVRARIIATYIKNKFDMLESIEQNGALYVHTLSDNISQAISATSAVVENCCVNISLTKEIDSRVAMLIFDWVETLCEFALTFGKPTLNITIGEEADKVVLSALVGGIDTHKKIEFNKDLLRKTALYSGKAGVDVSADSMDLTIKLPMEVL